MTLALAPAPVLDDNGDALWAGGSITDHGLMIYTEGDCWALAWHVARLVEPLLGPGRLYTLGRKRDWHHVVVRVGEDLYLDATGLKSQAELEAEWHRDLRPVPTAFEARVGTYQAYLDTDFSFDAGHPEANRIAVLLLEQYCPSL